ncbi:MAG: P-type conjugative transfer ATPase TrbB [Pseudomonadales bacterium]
MTESNVVTSIETHEDAHRLSMLESAMAPLMPYLNDPTVVEIMSNPDGRLWVERAGKNIEQCDASLPRTNADRIIRLLATIANTVVNYKDPSFTATLPKWGCRVQADIPPVVAGPALTIRKPAQVVYSLADYVRDGIMTQRQSDIIRKAVLARKNVVVSGGAGTGKTTLTNALLAVLNDSTERIVMIEDNRELQCTAPNLYAIYIYEHYPLARAVADSLRRRPDRIIVGEVRDAAALDMLKAWNTGHPGGIATVHANTTLLTLDRLCEMIEEKNGISNKTFVGRSVDLIVHMERDPSTKANRRLSGIVEVNCLVDDDAWELKEVD